MFVVPLLVGSAHWKHRTDRILVVDCSVDIQIARVMQRNQLSVEQVKAIIAAQSSREERLQAADDVVENDGDSAALVPQVDRLHALYCQLAGRQPNS